MKNQIVFFSMLGGGFLASVVMNIYQYKCNFRLQKKISELKSEIQAVNECAIVLAQKLSTCYT